MIEFSNNNIIIRQPDTNDSEVKKLLKRLSVYNRVTHKYTEPVYLENNGDIYLPFSIGVDFVKKYMPSEKVIYNPNIEVTPKEIDIECKNAPRNDTQERAIAFLMTLPKDQISKERMISLETGKGKTYVSIATICKLGVAPLIIVDSVDLADQWKREFLKHTNIDESDIIILSGMESVEAAKTGNYKVYIAIHRTLQIVMQNGFDELNNLFKTLGIGIKIFDEAHEHFQNMCFINCLTSTRYTVYLTATPGRSNSSENSLYKLVMKKIPFFDGKDVGIDAFATAIMMKIDSMPPEYIKKACKSKYANLVPAKWANFLVTKRPELLHRVVTRVLSSRISKTDNGKKVHKIALVFPTIEMIDFVYNSLIADGYSAEQIGRFIGETKPNERLTTLSKEIILTNNKIFNKGIDVPDLELLANFVPMASKVNLEQLLGRLRYGKDKKSIYIDIRDEGFTGSKIFYYNRLKLLRNKTERILETNYTIKYDQLKEKEWNKNEQHNESNNRNI